MPKQKLTSEIFKKSIKSMLNSKNIPKEQELFSSEKVVTYGKIIRDIGQECFNCAPTNVWGKVTGLEEKMSLLDDERINSFNGFLVLGYGDAEGNGWYGAGPTRDMRRAYYTPMLLVLQPDVNLGQKGFFSTKLSNYINKFADSLDLLNLSNPSANNYQQNNFKISLISGISSVSEKEDAGFRVFATNQRKSKKDYFCNLGILLKFGDFSGHRFLPQEAREGSPLYGPLSLAMNGKENLMQGPVKELYGFLHSCFNKFKKPIETLPLKENYKIFPMVFVDNS